MFSKLFKFFDKKEVKTKQKYTCCRFLHGGITFEFNSVRTCCSNNGGVTYVSDFEGEKINWKTVQKKRKKVIDDCKKGILPVNCRHCVELETKEWEEKQKISEIYFLHWDHCNCACIYCLQKEHGSFLLKEPRSSRHYDAFPLVKDLYNKKLVSKDVHVELVGGDLCMLNETEDIISLALDNGVGRISFHSSVVDYSKGLERALREAPTDFDCSIDCGSRESYRKIKQIDAFDRVVANLKRYANCHESAPDKIISKYIIIDGVNDNIEELEQWLQITKDIGIKKCKIDVNFRRFFPEYRHNDPKVPQLYYELFDYYYKRIDELGLQDCCWLFTKQVLENGGVLESSFK